MTNDRIQELEEKSKRSERDILVVAKAKAQQAVNTDPSAANLAALEKATKMLTEYDVRLNPSEPSFDNRIEALKWLKRQGYKIGKSKFYIDCKKKLCRLQDDGAIFESDLKKYIRKAELQKLSEGPDIDPNDTIIKKSQEELEKLRMQNRLLQLQLDEKLGKYISRTDFEMEFAAKVAILKQGLEHMIYSYAFEWVEVVLDGEPETNAQRLIDRMKQDLERQFNDFANIKKFQIVFGNLELEKKNEIISSR